MISNFDLFRNGHCTTVEIELGDLISDLVENIISNITGKLSFRSVKSCNIDCSSFWNNSQSFSAIISNKRSSATSIVIRGKQIDYPL